MPTPKPVSLTIRSYQVGFGDCFLLTFKYPAPAGGIDQRHVLIDCGSTGRPAGAPSLKEVAKLIAKDCGAKLTAVIATHRHADHINGFATDDGEASGDILRALQPKLVVQPWTEDPKAKPEATAPPVGASGLRAAGRRRFVAGLDGMHAFAALLLEDLQRPGLSLSARARQQLRFLGEENIKNLSAVQNLMTMGPTEYLHYGKKTKLTKLLPGVKIHVLGPPTPEQYPEITKQRDKDAAEFWHLLGASARRLTAAGGIMPFAPRFASGSRARGLRHPPHTRWIINRLKAAHVAQRLEIVRALDDAMNNTSLILLFEVGGKKFLFPGDAQIENWNYALKDAPAAAANRDLLKTTDFYKVGHHGSLNATPKSLWKLFAKKSSQQKAGRLLTAVSTMSGKHGSTASQTEVPRRTLVTALKTESNLLNTQDLPAVKRSWDKTFNF